MRCIFPEISSDLLDDIINGTLELRYSLVAASVPGLDNLHLMSQFVFVFVDDPVITPFNGSISYQPGSSMTILFTVSVYIMMCIYALIFYIMYMYCVSSFRVQILMRLKTVN